MNDFNFWYRWLLIATVFFALFGLVVALAGDSIIFQLYNSYLTERFWHSPELPVNVREFKAFIFGPLGGTITGKYVLMLYVILFPFKRRERWAWNAIVISHVAWFVPDSTISLYYGAAFNIWMINLVPLAVLGIPLLFTRKYFKAEADSPSSRV